MYTGLVHTHRLVVTLFLLIYLVKGILLLMNRKEALARFTKATRIPEMIISFLFLATGVGMLAMGAAFTSWRIIKLALVVASIPIAVIAFRRENKLLAALVMLLLLGIYGGSEMAKRQQDETPLATDISTDPTATNYSPVAHGQALYTRNCVVCHGENGARMAAGAKNLQVSQLTDEEMYQVIANGKNTMAAYKDVAGYDEAGINAVIAYIKTLKAAAN